MNLHFATIITSNWFERGVITLESIRKHHPIATYSILILDDKLNITPPTWLTVYQNSYISLNQLESYLYSPYELACAVRPKFASKLLENHEQVWLVDADIMFYSALPLFPTEYDLYLTPHLLYLSPLIENPLKTYDFLNTVSVGVWNAGIVGYNKTTATLQYLSALSSLLKYHCHISENNTLYLDQSWYNLAPIYCKVYAIQEPGINVSHWNLEERAVIKRNQQFFVNNSYPLIAFHFSSLQPFTIYPNTPAESLEAVTELITDYSSKIQKLQQKSLPDKQPSQENRKRVLYALQLGVIDFDFIPTSKSIKKLPTIKPNHLPFFRLTRSLFSTRYSLFHKLLHPIAAVKRYLTRRNR
jgi:hypothetical protein